MKRILQDLQRRLESGKEAVVNYLAWLKSYSYRDYHIVPDESTEGGGDE